MCPYAIISTIVFLRLSRNNASAIVNWSVQIFDVWTVHTNLSASLVHRQQVIYAIKIRPFVIWETTELDTEGDHTAGHNRSLNLKFRWI